MLSTLARCARPQGRTDALQSLGHNEAGELVAHGAVGNFSQAEDIELEACIELASRARRPASESQRRRARWRSIRASSSSLPIRSAWFGRHRVAGRRDRGPQRAPAARLAGGPDQGRDLRGDLLHARPAELAPPNPVRRLQHADAGDGGGRDRHRGRATSEWAARWDTAERSVITGLAEYDLRDVFRRLHGYDRRTRAGSSTPAAGASGAPFRPIFASGALNAIHCDYHHEWRENKAERSLGDRGGI